MKPKLTHAEEISILGASCIVAIFSLLLYFLFLGLGL